MPEVLGNPPSPRTALFWNGDEWQWALVDAAGHLQIDAVSLLGLEGALQSVATDRLQVRGEDQHFSIEEVVAQTLFGAISGADGFFDSPAVPDGRYWIITNVTAADATRATTAHQRFARHDGVDILFDYQLQAFALGEPSSWSGHVFLDAGDVVRVSFAGGLVADVCRVSVTGYQMTIET